MIPNMSLGDTIMYMAGKELGLSWSALSGKTPNQRPNPVFDFLPDMNAWLQQEHLKCDASNGTVTSGTTRTTAAVSYISVYKGASNQINNFHDFVYAHFLQQQGNNEDNEDSIDDTVVVWTQETWHFQGMNRTLMAVIYTVKVEKPCLITAVRDPVGRFLSAYNEIEYRLEQHNNETAKKSTTPGHHPWGFTKLTLGSQALFCSFVQNIISWAFHCPSRHLREFCQASGLELMHLWPTSGMLHVLHPQLGRHFELAGYLGGMTNLNERWPAFVAHTRFDDAE